MAILKECRKLGFHTAIETSGYCSLKVFSSLLEEVDLVLFDLKVVDAELHRTLTGKRNRLILNNVRLLAKSRCAVQPRMPLIPGINDSEDNIRGTASLLHALNFTSIELMPYHEFGRSKYAALGKPYVMIDSVSAKQQDADRASKLFEEYGIKCSVSIF